jgi:hypothetical protein
VVGDSRHGLTRSAAQSALAEEMPAAVRALVKGRLMLHARSLRIVKPMKTMNNRTERDGGLTRRAPCHDITIEVEAPVPDHFAALLRVLGLHVEGDSL